MQTRCLKIAEHLKKGFQKENAFSDKTLNRVLYIYIQMARRELSLQEIEPQQLQRVIKKLFRNRRGKEPRLATALGGREGGHRSTNRNKR